MRLWYFLHIPQSRYWVVFYVFCRIFPNNYFKYTFRMSNSFDSDQARRSVEPDLCPNCLQRLRVSADDTSIYVGKELNIYMRSAIEWN